MRRLPPMAAAAVALAASVCAQSAWQMEGGRMRARVGGADAAELAPGRVDALTDGTFGVHFPSNANGKPRSLEVEVPKGASVVVGVADAGACQRRQLELGGSEAMEDTLTTSRREAPIHIQTTGDGDAAMRDYRLSATVSRKKGCEMFALVARHTKDGGCYLFAIDWGASKVRLERVMGGDHFVVQQRDVPDGLRRVTLTLQVHGFRIEGLVDDAPVVRSFDGAISAGAPGIAWAGERAAPSAVWLEDPAVPLASAAVVQRGRAATLHAAVPEPPGSLAVVELLLDRPHRWIPRSPGGFEPWLRQPLAAPVVAWGDWRGSLGEDTVGEVGFEGGLQVELRWPELPALRLHTALVRVHLATPDGGPIVGTTPAVRVVF